MRDNITDKNIGKMLQIHYENMFFAKYVVVE